MHQNRIIPCLLLHNKGLVKTVKFKNPVYLGDPLNAIRLFNEKEVDELIFIDIDRLGEGAQPDYALIESIASECFMPLCYGGRVRTIEQMRQIFALGVEKISLSSAAVNNPDLVRKASEIFGSQSVTVTMDVKKSLLGTYQVYTENGTKNTRLNPVLWAKTVADLGAGEILVNSIDQDGVMKGYDLKLVQEVTKSVNIPVIALGGAGKLKDLKDVIHTSHASAAAAGSLFVFTGIHKAVLINYPTREVIDDILTYTKPEEIL